MGGGERQRASAECRVQNGGGLGIGGWRLGNGERQRRVQRGSRVQGFSVQGFRVELRYVREKGVDFRGGS